MFWLSRSTHLDEVIYALSSTVKTSNEEICVGSMVFHLSDSVSDTRRIKAGNMVGQHITMRFMFALPLICRTPVYIKRKLKERDFI